jgi:hypothetical protein
LIVSLAAGVILPAYAAGAGAESQSDVLIFSNGDRITGHLERAAGGKVFFKTDGAGELQVPWDKIRELQATEPFAVIVAKARIRHGRPNAQIPQGGIHVKNQKMIVHTAPGEQAIPVNEIAFVVDEATYQSNVEHTPGMLHGWAGSVTGGASTVTSTQNETTFNSGITLARPVPSVPWMATSHRTLLDFTSSYGKISQPNTPTIKTNIFHAGAEQDEYFSPRFYTLGQVTFDHNNAQGLDLQQMYGGGFGYTVLKRPRQELDVTSTMDYTKQQFQVANSNLNLIGTNFGNNYLCKLPRGIVLTEISSITPEWNNMSAYSANSNVGLSLPVLKKLSLSVQMIDSYLNNPPTGFQRNSMQFNTGVTYTLP